MIIKRKLFAKLPSLSRKVRNIRYRVGGKTRKAAKKAIKLGRNVEKAETYFRTTTPDKFIGDIGAFGAKHPVQLAGTVATFPISSAAAEAALQKAKPYRVATEWTGKQYEKHLRGPIEGIARSIMSIA